LLCEIDGAGEQDGAIGGRPARAGRGQVWRPPEQDGASGGRPAALTKLVLLTMDKQKVEENDLDEERDGAGLFPLTRMKRRGRWSLHRARQGRRSSGAREFLHGGASSGPEETVTVSSICCAADRFHILRRRGSRGGAIPMLSLAWWRPWRRGGDGSEAGSKTGGAWRKI